MSEKVGIKCEISRLRKSVPWLIVSWMTKHLDHLLIYYLFKKLYYFQGTTFCILAETKLSIRTQHLREHVRSSSRHLENRRYKKQSSCVNDLTLLMSRTIFSASSSFSCWKVLIQLFMSLLDEASPGRPFTTSEYFLADIGQKRKSGLS